MFPDLTFLESSALYVKPVNVTAEAVAVVSVVPVLFSVLAREYVVAPRSFV